MPEKVDEQYRKAALVLAADVRAARYRSLCFASATRGEGTTSAVLQVARQLKDSCAMNPLVVEFNRARPALAGMLGLDPARSVAAVAAGKAAPRECVQQGPGGLALLPVGDFTSLNSAGQKVESAIQAIQRDLEPEYDVSLWDAPPILEAADAFLVARMVPRVVLVVAAGKARYEVLQRIEKELASHQAELLGSILVKQKKVIPSWIYRFLVQ